MSLIFKKIKVEFYFTLFFILSICFVHALSFDKMPTRIHAWAQSDHYALALGFIDNGFDFFHPQTYSLNHQFPSEQEVDDPKGITAVDFPLLHYIVGFIMYLTGIKEPWIFRLVSLLFSYVGLLYLFRILYDLKGLWISLFAVSFVMFQPIYCYYQNGFHVSSAAFSTQLIGISLMLKHFYKPSSKAFYIGVIFLTLAALMRFTQVITLIALFCSFVLRFIITRKHNGKILAVFLGLLVVGGYFVYNKHLASLYGSVFLGSPLPAETFRDFMFQIFYIAKSYLRGFLPFLHLFAFIVVLITVPKEKWNLNSFWLQWLGFSLFGTFVFSLLMSWSLSAHDYYSLDTWMAPLVICLIWALLNIETKVYSKKGINLFVLLFVIGAFSIALENQLRKYDEKIEVRGVDLTIETFKESSNYLNSIIPDESRVVIITGSGWNTPMMGWKRPVFRVAWKFEEQIPLELEKTYDYIITQDRTFNDEVIGNYPQFYSKVKLLGSNGKISIWTNR
ncbi:glycosyltransferase family 39 protein [Carboxylicivirga mesophila]|uniref:Glycosyltransferase family 39 protein n=1 Tax=Carboxylicivirga mesophila TaxID=1166478 RepID=A0ABS5K419_9BACT|nr:glycosyltransferase family 39 protein [Carboxylicivirga mesophila]MBS2209784.1 glycosyltransferase family 39 protein [Carboxylicivirga mesophila]